MLGLKLTRGRLRRGCPGQHAAAAPADGADGGVGGDGVISGSHGVVVSVGLLSRAPIGGVAGAGVAPPGRGGVVRV